MFPSKAADQADGTSCGPGLDTPEYIIHTLSKAQGKDLNRHLGSTALLAISASAGGWEPSHKSRPSVGAPDEPLTLESRPTFEVWTSRERSHRDQDFASLTREEHAHTDQETLLDIHSPFLRSMRM